LTIVTLNLTLYYLTRILKLFLKSWVHLRSYKNTLYELCDRKALYNFFLKSDSVPSPLSLDGSSLWTRNVRLSQNIFEIVCWCSDHILLQYIGIKNMKFCIISVYYVYGTYYLSMCVVSHIICMSKHEFDFLLMCVYFVIPLFQYVIIDWVSNCFV